MIKFIVLYMIVAASPEIQEPGKLTLESPNKEATIVFQTGIFDRQAHRLGFKKYEDDQPVLVTIDGREYSGTDGAVPVIEIEAIRIIYKNACLRFPEASFRDLYQPHASTLQIEHHSGGIEVNLEGGDGAGSYEVQWKVDPLKQTLESRLSQFPEPEEPRRDIYLMENCDGKPSEPR